MDYSIKLLTPISGHAYSVLKVLVLIGKKGLRINSAELRELLREQGDFHISISRLNYVLNQLCDLGCIEDAEGGFVLHPKSLKNSKKLLNLQEEAYDNLPEFQ
ncbi:MAG: hypothetical protein KF746_27515 [Chitinophagaceae bacterium]|nr:hypothetical protein [Chitinophagaceae bacterium]